MSNITFTGISSAIIGKLKQSALLEQAVILNYEPSNGFAGYPAVTVTPSQERASFADSNRNQVNFFFDIKVAQERLDTSAQNAEQLVAAIVDDLMANFNTDYQMNNYLLTNAIARPLQVKWSYRKAPEVEERVATLTVEVLAIQ